MICDLIAVVTSTRCGTRVERRRNTRRASACRWREMSLPPSSSPQAIVAGLAARRRPLCLPIVEASDVKLRRVAALDPRHHESALDGATAGAARFVVPDGTPDGRHRVLRQAAISELFSDERAKDVFFHGGLSRSVRGASAQAIFTEDSTHSERQPERPRCRLTQGITTQAPRETVSRRASHSSRSGVSAAP